jgi:hypothetical protein
MSQKLEILAYLIQHESGITPREAAEKFACWRLASRISELKRDGHLIAVTLEGNAAGSRHARYHLIATADQLADRSDAQEAEPEPIPVAPGQTIIWGQDE